ncbi:MAG: ATP-dependent DNA ligase [Bdellovibrionota bacterium]
MEALSVEKIPEGSQWQYEPKWDGFRCLAFRDGKQVRLQSKAEKDLSRYFPELVQALLKIKADKFVLDGEIVIPMGKVLSFDSLLQRIHPAATRIKKLSTETPAHYIVFDILLDDKDRSLIGETLGSRRKKLEAFAKKYFAIAETVHLSPATDRIAQTKAWAKKASNALDGIIAKRVDLPYESGTREGMQKIKARKTADCVVGGFRYASRGKQVGSLLLGLYDKERKLNHVGYVGTAGKLGGKELTAKLEKLIEAPGFTGHAPGGPSRWSTERTGEWEPLKPSLVVEVEFDHVTGGRFRHGTKFLRWRPDKKPAQCSMDQIEQKKGAPFDLVR